MTLGKLDQRNFPTMSVLNGLVNTIGFVGICSLIWMVSGYANRIENLERAQLDAKAAAIQASMQSAQQYNAINDTLRAFPLATDQLARAAHDILDLRETDRQFDLRVRSLEQESGKQGMRLDRLDRQASAPVRDTR